MLPLNRFMTGENFLVILNRHRANSILSEDELSIMQLEKLKKLLNHAIVPENLQTIPM